MGKVKENIVGGLPFKKRRSFNEIGGRYRKLEILELYKHLAHKLPVDLKYLCHEKKNMY